jgi:hypothetical protein
MTDWAESLDILKDFPPVPTKAWEASIHVDLKGEDYNKKLVWKSDEGIVVRPYYRSEDIKDLESQIGKIPATFPVVRGRGSQSWKQVESQGEVAADGIRVDAIHEQGGTIVQELGYGIALGVERLVERSHAGGNVDEAAKGIWFVFAIGSNYFFEIANLRAARMLWARAVSAFQPRDESSCLMKVHACTALCNKSIYDPFANVLRATTKAPSWSCRRRRSPVSLRPIWPMNSVRWRQAIRKPQPLGAMSPNFLPPRCAPVAYPNASCRFSPASAPPPMRFLKPSEQRRRFPLSRCIGHSFKPNRRNQYERGNCNAY